jgi:uncharacterized protein (DUF1697 family)
MPKYVAFLRAINVGGHIVKMDRLRKLFEELGFTNVKTFIASGNVIFDSRSRNAATLERKIEMHLESTLEYELATFVRSIAQLHQIEKHKPFADPEQSGPNHGLYIAFLREPPETSCVEELMTHRSDCDDFHLRDREVYWLCRTKVTESPFSGARLERTMKMPATVRNSTTIRKLAAFLSSAD